MSEKKITRKEFLKLAGFGMFTILVLPGLKKLNVGDGLKPSPTAYREARYYENLAG